MKERNSEDPRYLQQQQALDEIAIKYGLVAVRPDRHQKEGQKNKVIFYIRKDGKLNEKLGYVPISLQEPVWSFENTGENGQLNYEFANFGKLDLRSSRWREILEGYIRLAFAKNLQSAYIAGSGGYLALREADSINNDLNREEIKALKQIYGAAYLVDVNYFGKKKERVLAGEESVFDEVSDEPVYNFAGSFCVPQKDRELERLILAWNRDDRIPKRVTDIDKIQDRVDEIGGINLIWF